MYRSIFIPLSSNGDQSPALAFGAAAAKAFDAKAECVFASKTLILLQEADNEKIARAYRNDGYTASQVLAEELCREQFQARAAQVAQWFEMSRQKLRDGGRLQWRDSLNLFGETTDQISNECMFHDLTVMSFDLGVSVFDAMIEGALFATGKPLAVLRRYAPDRDIGDLTVLLAWKPSPPAIRAMWYALPFLQKAKRVIVTAVEEEDGECPDLDKPVRYLATHGVKAVPHAIRNARHAPDALQIYYEEQKADLLVMGAYSHSRMRELILGGFTRYFLNAASCNLLLAH